MKLAKLGLMQRLGVAWKLVAHRAITVETFTKLGLLFGTPTASGMPIDVETAMTISAVFACIRVISEDIGKLPLITYKRTVGQRGKSKAIEHPAYKLLLRRPNGFQTAQSVKELITAWALGWGNGYGEIEFTNGGKPLSIRPIHPRRVQPFIDLTTREVMYRVDGTIIIPAWKMIHIKGLGDDGLQGYSIVNLARESMGCAMAAERFAATLWKNGMRFSGVLEHPGELGDQATINLRKSMEAQYAGTENAHRMLVLEEGMKFKETSIAPEDAQFLETRQFDVEQIARWYRVPPHKVGHLARSTNNNIEHQALEYVGDTLMPWCVRWEEEVNIKLLGGDASEGEPPYFAEFYLDGMLRGDMMARYRAYALGRQWGWLSPNDVSELENRNPLPGTQGDTYLVPLNMVDMSKLDEEEDPNNILGDGGPKPKDTGDASDEGRAAALTPIVTEAITRLMRVEHDKWIRGKLKDLPAFIINHRSHTRLTLYSSVAALCTLRGIKNVQGALDICVERHLQRMQEPGYFTRPIEEEVNELFDLVR